MTFQIYFWWLVCAKKRTRIWPSAKSNGNIHKNQPCLNPGGCVFLFFVPKGTSFHQTVDLYCDRTRPIDTFSAASRGRVGGLLQITAGSRKPTLVHLERRWSLPDNSWNPRVGECLAGQLCEHLEIQSAGYWAI